MEAIRGDLTLAELAAKHGVHHTMICAWKRQAVEGMASLFDGGDHVAKTASDAELKKLHVLAGWRRQRRSSIIPVIGGASIPSAICATGPASFRQTRMQPWLADVLARIADIPQIRLCDLLLWNWKADRQVTLKQDMAA